MPVPTFQDIMLPLLQLLQDQREHRHSDVIEAMARHFSLTDQDRRILLPSGKQSQFDSRVGWARTYMSKAGLIESSARGRYHITQRGLDLLATSPTRIDVSLLRRYEEFREFLTPTRKGSVGNGDDDPQPPPDTTPDEVIQSTYATLRQSLERELLERVKQCSPQFFEQLVIDVLVAMGYGGTRKDAERTGRSGDGGIDGIIKEDRLGLDVIYVQAKRWEGTVSSEIVQRFIGALVNKHAQKGVFITTSTFSKDARNCVQNIGQKVILIDGEELAAFMVDYDVGVAPAETFVIKKPDLDYFEQQ